MKPSIPDGLDLGDCMNKLSLSVGMASFVAAYALTAAPTAHAATASTNTLATGSICQLSIPTTNTGVRPKATGFRNESTTTSNFVICPMVLPNASGGGITALYAGFYSLDGTSRDVSCTAVTSWFGGATPQYSSKTLAITTTTSYQLLTWDASDFGGTAGGTFVAMSVTCSLPPQTVIDVLQSNYTYNVGT